MTGAPLRSAQQLTRTKRAQLTPFRRRARRLEDGRSVLAQLGRPEAEALAPAAPAAALEDFAALAQQLAPGSAVLEAELGRRWAALAVRGEETAPQQAALNAASRRSSAAELMGRAQLGGAQPDEVLRPQPEVRF